eukprot:COSAG01_NODE_6267_length_3763_cov_10.815502_3_plen_283_part_00
MDRVWPWITNADALAVNAAWAGQPGTLVRSYPLPNGGQESEFMVVQDPSCTAPMSTGWQLQDGELRTPAAGVCVTGKQWQQAAFVGCPPVTRGDPAAQCGLMTVKCSPDNTEQQQPPQTWSQNATGLFFGTQQRVYLTDGCAVNETIGAKCSRRSANVAMQKPHDNPKTGVAPDAQLTFTPDKQLKSATGVCLSLQGVPGAQLWSKPLRGSSVAILILNTHAANMTMALPLSDVPKMPCGAGSCHAKNVWTGERTVVSGHITISLASHETAYFILSSSKTSA